MIARFFYDNTLFDGGKSFDDRIIDNTLFGDSKICMKHAF
jgi:hypothetical protein